MAKYNTKQKECILLFIKDNKRRHVTVLEIQEELNKKNIKVSTSTIYRTLKELEALNKVIKFDNGSDDYACFQYVEEHSNVCHHFKCVKCNELFHFNCITTDTLNNHIRDEHNFKVDNLKTVFYGTCSNCDEQVKEDGKDGEINES